MDINISLEQGKQFKKLQKNIATKTKIKEAYSNNYLNSVINNETKQFVSLQKKTKEGFDNINNTNTNDTPNITKPILTTPDVVEIQTLEQQYNSLIQQLSVKQQSILEEDRNYIDRTDKNQNKFLNNNIQLTDGSKGYVNNSGVVKWYGTEDVFNNTAGKNGCPSNNNMMSVNFAQNAEYQNPGASIPVDPALKVGSYMLNGQGCGNEGKNVYVSKMINSNKSTNIGCYNNTDGNAMIRYFTTNEAACKTFAINQGYKYYGLGDYDSNTNNGTCYFSNDKTSATQYGNATNINTPVAIWSTNTNGKGVSFLNISTEGSIQLCATDGSIIYETTKDKTCTKSYSISNKTDAKGNDIKKLSGTTLDNCKKTCYDNPQCAGFAMNNSTNSECWIKSNISKTSKKSNRDLYTKLPTKSNISNCVFFLTLQSDGNLCIYRGNSPQNNKGGGAVWCSMTNGKQQQANSDWLSTKGKYGKSFLTSGQTLSLGEWIGSDDGKMRLLLQQDGNLVLQTSINTPGCVTNPKDNMVYGNKGVISIYELEAGGIKNNMGKLGYVDDNSDLREYPASMIGNSNDYNIQQNTSYMPASGNDVINQSTVKNIDECQTACTNNNNCKGFMLAQSSNICVQYKNTNGSIFNGAQGYTFGERKPKLLNDASCGLDYTEIDTNQWQNYNKGEKMLSTTKCGYGLIRENTYQEMLDIQLNMLDVANKIVDKLNTIVTNTNNTINQGTDMNWANEQLTKYKQIQNSLANLQHKPTIVSSKQEGFLNMTDINGMLSDSNINVLAANYNYILWSIFALGLVTITLKHINK
jgi:hypothetical protein